MACQKQENLVRKNDRWCGHHFWLQLRWGKSLSFCQLWINIVLYTGIHNSHCLVKWLTLQISICSLCSMWNL